MGYTQSTFLFVFLPVSLLTYFILSRIRCHGRFQNLIPNSFAIIISIAFYAWGRIENLWLFLSFAVVVYLFGNIIHYQKNVTGTKQKETRLWLVAGLVIVIGFLFYFNYVSPIISLIISEQEAKRFSETLIPLLGISFLVFESVSYLTDIYRGDAKPGSFGDALLFLSFFPKLISGPIILWKDFSGQLKRPAVTVMMLSDGLQRIIIGYAKKSHYRRLFRCTGVRHQ